MGANDLPLLLVSLANCIGILTLTRLVRQLRAREHRIEQDIEFETAASPLPGTQPPHFVGETLNGEAVDLSSLKNRPVLLLFFSVRCPHCVEFLKVFLQEPHAFAQHTTTLLLLKASRHEILNWTAKHSIEASPQFSAEFVALPAERTRAFDHYHPRGLLPAYCLIASSGLIESIGLIGSEDWQVLANRQPRGQMVEQ